MNKISIFKVTYFQVARWKVEWTLPHRLLQKRSLVSLRQYEKNFNEHDGSGLDCHFEWLVKWRGLDYEHSTWELETESFIKSLEGQSLIRDYENRRNKAKIVSCLSSVEKVPLYTWIKLNFHFGWMLSLIFLQILFAICSYWFYCWG